jgi:hypothetical protein
MHIGFLFLLLAALITAIDEDWRNIAIWFFGILFLIATWLGIFYFIGIRA